MPLIKASKTLYMSLLYTQEEENARDEVNCIVPVEYLEPGLWKPDRTRET